MEEIDAHQATVEAPVGFTPGPWHVRDIETEDGNGKYISYEITDEHGATIMDATNSGVALIEWEHDGEPNGCVRHWDSMGEANAKLIAMAPTLLEERNRLREALEFYADAEVYKTQRGWCPARGEIQKASDIQIDNYGDRAREALGVKRP